MGSIGSPRFGAPPQTWATMAVAAAPPMKVVGEKIIQRYLEALAPEDSFVEEFKNVMILGRVRKKYLV